MDREDDTIKSPNNDIPAEDEFSDEPLITISRDFACGGEAVAHKMAAKLGWNLYDHRLIDSTDVERKAERGAFEELDEKITDYIRESAGEFFRSGFKGDAPYMRGLVRVLLHLTKEGSSVIVGRGAGLIIPEQRRLAVRLTGPLDWRIERYARKEDISPEKAREIIMEEDEARSLFIRENFDTDIADPINYDLVINMKGTDLSTAQFLILSTLRARFGLSDSALPLSESGIRKL